MAKFHGIVGFVSFEETSPGIHSEVPTEKWYKGNIIRGNPRWEQGDQPISDLSIGNQVSIVADAYALANFPNARYAEWLGTKWNITSFEVRRPRIIMNLGGVYNGS